MKPLISVVVCTYNRSPLLPVILGSLLDQDLDSSAYEIIVVDNNSTDKTAEAVKVFCDENSIIKYVFEQEQGISHARNTGWKVSKGQYVAYTDDDCKIPRAWLSVARSIIETISPPVFGGPIYPFYDQPKPTWFKDKYGSYLTGSQTRFLGKDEYLFGGNMFFESQIIETFGDFDTRLGMMGRKPGFGEETELVDRIRSSLGSDSIYYDQDLFNYHLVDPKKYVLTEHLKRRFANGKTDYLTFQQNLSELGWLIESGKVATSLSYKALLGFLVRDHQKYPYLENYIFEVIGRTVGGAGRVYAHYSSKFINHDN